MRIATRSRFRVFVLSLLFCGGVLRAAPSAPEDQGSLKVGDKAPQLKLLDQTGTERSLTEFLGRGKVALVFYRSASW
jgi:hypothetical protein